MGDEPERARERAEEAPDADVPAGATASIVGDGAVEGASPGGGDDDRAPMPAAVVSVTALLRAGRRLLGRRRVWATLAVAVVVVLVVGGVRLWTTDRDTGRPGWARSPESAVRGYLTAVAQGRADDALAYLANPPDDRTFLTDEVLARSHQLAPLTSIVVHRGSGDDWSRSVSADFQVGADAQASTFTVDENGGYWFVVDALPVVQFGSRSSASIADLDVPVLVDGVPLAAGKSQVTVFPGRYEMTADHPFVDLDHQVTVVGLATVTLEPRLTDDGRQRIADAARTLVDTCQTQHSFDTDCSFRDPEDFRVLGSPPDPATISWSVTGDLPQPGATLEKVDLGHGDVTGLSSVAVPITIQVSCAWTDTAGHPDSFDVFYSPNYYVADVTDPDHVVVTFVHVF